MYVAGLKKKSCYDIYLPKIIQDYRYDFMSEATLCAFHCIQVMFLDVCFGNHVHKENWNKHLF